MGPMVPWDHDPMGTWAHGPMVGPWDPGPTGGRPRFLVGLGRLFGELIRRKKNFISG